MDNTTLPAPAVNGRLSSTLSDVDPSTLISRPSSPGRSAGPRTLAGKSRSRLNAIKHGLTACDQIFLTGLTPERREAYFNLRMMLRRHYRPATEMERLLVDRIAVNHFRILTLLRIESSAVASTGDNLTARSSVVPHLDRFSRYDTRLERQNRTLHNRLMKLYEQRGVSFLNRYTFND